MRLKILTISLNLKFTGSYMKCVFIYFVIIYLFIYLELHLNLLCRNYENYWLLVML